MTVVGLLGAITGTPADVDAGRRSSGDAGSRFGAVLQAAGEKMDGAAPGRESLAERPAGSDASAVEQSAGGESDAAADATSAAMLQLAAQLTPVARDGGEEPPAGDSVGGDQGDTAASSPTNAESELPIGIGTGTGTGTAVAAPADTVLPGALPTAPATSLATELPPMPTSASTEGAEGGSPASASSASTSASSANQVSATSPSIAQTGDDRPELPGAAPERPQVSLSTAAGAEAARGASHTAAPTVSPISASAGTSTGSSAESDGGQNVQTTQPASAAASVAPSPTVPPAAQASAPDAPAAANRAVAAQVAPVVINIAQRPAGTHHLTMTVNPDSLGPVTLRAHISATGEVQVELSGATDAGRDALRAIVVDLRRDLAAVMPHATLSIGQGAGADANGDRGGQSPAGGTAAEQGDGERDAGRGRTAPRPDADRSPELPRIIQTMPHAGSGTGLDIFA